VREKVLLQAVGVPLLSHGVLEGANDILPTLGTGFVGVGLAILVVVLALEFDTTNQRVDGNFARKARRSALLTFVIPARHQSLKAKISRYMLPPVPSCRPPQFWQIVTSAGLQCKQIISSPRRPRILWHSQPSFAFLKTKLKYYYF